MRTFLILVSICSFQALACSNGTQSEMYELGKEEFRLEVEFTKKVAEKADLIVIATVASVRERESSDLSDYTYFDVSLRDVKTVKGSISQRIYWKEEVNPLINISCGVPVLYNFVSVEKTYTYLIYIKNNEILRVNDLGPEIPVLTGVEELKLITEQHITSS
jgi:hypothetical protein